MFFQNINRDNYCDVLFELESYVKVKNKHFFVITILRSDMCVRVLARALSTATVSRQDIEPISGMTNPWHAKIFTIIYYIIGPII
jgi:hypothetical protein